MRPLLLDIYRFTGFCVYPLARLAAPLISALPRRIAYNFFQRLGTYGSDDILTALSPTKTDTPVIWVHAASVGEMQAALLLVSALQQDCGGYRYVLSTTTKQGSQLAESRLPQGACCIMAPLDMPKAAVVIESTEIHTRTATIRVNLNQLKNIKVEGAGSSILEVPFTQAAIYGWYDNEFGSYTNMLGELTKTIADRMV